MLQSRDREGADFATDCPTLFWAWTSASTTLIHWLSAARVPPCTNSDWRVSPHQNNDGDKSDLVLGW